MKKILASTIWFLILIFATANIYLFISGTKLSESINSYEKEIKTLQQENMELEKEAVRFGSLQYAASIAAVLDFIKKAEPLFFENLKVAHK